MRIVHISPDSAFVSFLGSVFEEVAPGRNEFFVVAPGSPADLRHPLPGRVTTFEPHIRTARHLRAAAHGADLLVAHSMSAHAAVAFRSAAPDTLRVWSGWGADYYGTAMTDKRRDLLEPSTRQWALSQPPPNVRWRTLAAQAAIRRLYRVAARRTELFSAPIPNDEDIFRARFPSFNGDYTQLNYASTEHSFASAAVSQGADILVGNSATVENNHLDAFGLLARHDLVGRRVIVPLTYGQPEYRDEVLRVGHRLLGSAFHPLVEHQPLADYLDVVARCSVVIMNHRRQQGIGNIGAALQAGAHLYLNPRNPTLDFLREIGTHVRSIDELSVDPPPSVPIAEQLSRDTRTALNTFWGHDRVVSNVERLVARVGVQ